MKLTFCTGPDKSKMRPLSFLFYLFLFLNGKTTPWLSQTVTSCPDTKSLNG